jgi:hypothetical protein
MHRSGTDINHPYLVAVQWLNVRLSVQMHTLMRFSRKRGNGWMSTVSSGWVCKFEVRHTYKGSTIQQGPWNKRGSQEHGVTT